jgi:hypothetical protein
MAGLQVCHARARAGGAAAPLHRLRSCGHMLVNTVLVNEEFVNLSTTTDSGMHLNWSPHMVSPVAFICDVFSQ